MCQLQSTNDITNCINMMFFRLECRSRFNKTIFNFNFGIVNANSFNICLTTNRNKHFFSSKCFCFAVNFSRNCNRTFFFNKCFW